MNIYVFIKSLYFCGSFSRFLLGGTHRSLDFNVSQSLMLLSRLKGDGEMTITGFLYRHRHLNPTNNFGAKTGNSTFYIKTFATTLLKKHSTLSLSAAQ